MTTAGDEGTADGLVVATLRAAPDAVLFASELHAAGSVAEIAPVDLDAALDRLAADGVVLVVAHEPPDPHLAGHDLRLVAPVVGDTPDAVDRAGDAVRRRWADFVRQLLITHRCQ